MLGYTFTSTIYYAYVLEWIIPISIELSDLQNKRVEFDEVSEGRCLRLGFLEAEAERGLFVNVMYRGEALSGRGGKDAGGPE